MIYDALSLAEVSVIVLVKVLTTVLKKNIGKISGNIFAITYRYRYWLFLKLFTFNSHI